MKRLEHMKECLIACAQCEMNHLDQVDAKELGEVIDMIKDLEEAIYYCTITKAMKNENGNGRAHYPLWEEEYDMYPRDEMHKPDYRRMENGRMYFDGDRELWNDDIYNSSNSHYIRDSREGSSPIHRKMYMESKELHHDKAKQMQELESYVQELSKDITEMIKDSSPEEKQLLQQKIATLAAKIK